MISIYKYEAEAGLSDIIQKESKINIASVVQMADSPDVTQIDDFAKLLKVANAKANPDQLDLFYLESVLVSTGWNKNDDVFDVSEVWAARKTPVDKQFNYMHNETDIIGHITSSRAIDFKGQSIDDTLSNDQLPSQLDIVVGSVLYKYWSDDALQERMNQILAGIANGDWFVSMECLFPHFDYAVITPDDEHKVIARCDESSFLTKHLRIYGGSGEYEGHRIGRLLRNFGFSGKGLVDRPANIRSFILNFNDQHEMNSFAGEINTVKEINLMANEVSQTQYDELKVQCDELKAELLRIKAEDASAKEQALTDAEKVIADLTASNTALQTEFDALKEVVAAKDEQIASAATTLEETQASLDEAKANIDAINAEALKNARVASLQAKDISEDRVTELVDKFASASDEMFDSLLNALPNKAKCEDEKKDDDDEETDASTASLDEVVEEATTDLGVSDDSVDQVLAKASAWLSESILSTTKKED